MLNRRLGALVLAVLLSGALGLARARTTISAPPNPRPECPHGYDYQSFPDGRTKGFPANGRLAIPGPISSVPEFHDCQRLIFKNSGRLAYTKGFSAIFARVKLDSAVDALQSRIYQGLVVAEVYSEDDYEPLGIRVGFNCLWMKKSGGPTYRAVMISVAHETDCGGPLVPSATSTELQVESLSHGTAASSEIPPVARWDWNAADSTNYIGLRCVHDWCEIHRTKSAAHPFTSSPTFTPPPGASAFEKRVVGQKGWYDYQYLEDFDSQGNPVPSGVIGVVFPVAALDTLSAAFVTAKRWVPMARVVMFGTSARYQTKYNFRSIPLAAAGSGGVTVEACSGAWTMCDPGGFPKVPKPVCKIPATTGFVRILASDHTAKYFCNLLRPFTVPGFSIPGVTRWRWKVRDETLWIRCPSGCCEADPDA